MIIEVNEYNDLVLKEVYNGILLETSDGNQVYVYMRDDTIELNVMPKGKKEQLFIIDMEDVNIRKV